MAYLIAFGAFNNLSAVPIGFNVSRLNLVALWALDHVSRHSALISTSCAFPSLSQPIPSYPMVSIQSPMFWLLESTSTLPDTSCRSLQPLGPLFSIWCVHSVDVLVPDAPRTFSMGLNVVSRLHIAFRLDWALWSLSRWVILLTLLQVFTDALRHISQVPQHVSDVLNTP